MGMQPPKGGLIIEVPINIVEVVLDALHLLANFPFVFADNLSFAAE